jgi:hypothetical protein
VRFSLGRPLFRGAVPAAHVTCPPSSDGCFVAACSGIYPQLVTMPEPDDPCLGFIVHIGRCWQMVRDRNPQADHCYEALSWTGRWFSPRGCGGDCWRRPYRLGRRIPSLPLVSAPDPSPLLDAASDGTAPCTAVPGG